MSQGVEQPAGISPAAQLKTLGNAFDDPSCWGKIVVVLKKHFRLLIASILLMLSGCVLQGPVKFALDGIGLINASSQSVSDTAIEIDSEILTEIWRKKGLIFAPNFGNPPLVSAGDCLIAKASGSNDGGPKVMSMDGMTGDLQWSFGSVVNATDIQEDNSTFFFATQLGEIKAVEPCEGTTIWHQVIPSGMAIIRLHHAMDRLIAYDSDFTNYIYLADNGELEEEVSSSPELLIASEIGSLVKLGPGIVGWFEDDKEEPLWSVDVGGEFYESPQLSDSFLLIREGRPTGQVAVVDLRTGDVRWAAGQPAISNAAFNGDSVLFITTTGELVAMDQATGDQEILAELSEMLIENVSTSGTYIAVDESRQLVFLAVGASEELIALQFISGN